jgi:hypothetical protein
MLEMIDVTNTIESASTDFPPATMQSQNDEKLGDEIAVLWAAHLNAKNAARATKEELRTIRAKLGGQLHEMKKMLAAPGRGGQWSSFLRERGIPRASADRLVGHYEQLINPDANRPSEAISEPTEEDVQKLFTSVWPKLQRTLRSRQSLLLFVDLLTSQFNSRLATDRGILALTPPATAICPASSDGDSLGQPEVNAAALVTRPDDLVI